MFGPFAQWLGTSGVASYLRTLTWIWPLCETLHFVGLAVLVGTAGFFDLRLLGCFRRVPVSACKEFTRWAIGAIMVNLVTGLTFITMFPGQYLFSEVFWLKVLFLVIAISNALIFETRMGGRMAALKPGEDSPFVFKAIGLTSLVSWFFVLYFGRMLPFLGAAY
jgi:hypothetical protein